MRNRQRLFGIYLPFFMLLLLGAITLRTIASIGFFNYRYHYFTNRTIPLIANILIISAMVFFIIYILCAHRRIKLIPSFSSPSNYIPSAAISASLIFIVIHFVKLFISSDISLIKWISLIISLFAVLSVVYFALNTIFIRTVSARRANFGLCVIIFLALYLAYLYFDPTAPINSPIKTVDQLTYAFAAVFFLYEIRLSLGREQWTSYIIFGFLAASLAAYSSIPALITYFAKNRTVISNSIYETILTFTIFLFIALKLLLTDKLTENSESPLITKLKAAAQKRAEELSPSVMPQELPTEEGEDMPDENQISILDIENAHESNGISIEENQEEIINTEEELQ